MKSGEVSWGVLSGVSVGLVDIDDIGRMNCEIEDVERRIVDRVRDIWDDIDRMGNVARRSRPGAMMGEFVSCYLSIEEGQSKLRAQRLN